MTRRRFFATLAALICAGSLLLADNTQLFVDLFTRADNTDLGTNWDAGYTGQTNAQIVSNAVRGTSTATDSVETVNNVTLGVNQWSQITVTTIGAGVSAPGLELRWAAPATVSGYLCQALVGVGGTTTRIRSYSAGTPTNLVTENATTWASGNIMRFEANGSKLRCYRNGVLLLTATDTTWTATGRAGLHAFNDTNLANLILDTYSQGNITSIAGFMIAFHGGPPTTTFGQD